MKKLMVAMVMLIVITGCVSTQDKISAYKVKRDAVANKVISTKDKKDCIVRCNQDFSIGLDRASCKASCVVE